MDIDEKLEDIYAKNQEASDLQKAGVKLTESHWSKKDEDQMDELHKK